MTNIEIYDIDIKNIPKTGTHVDNGIKYEVIIDK